MSSSLVERIEDEIIHEINIYLNKYGLSYTVDETVEEIYDHILGELDIKQIRNIIEKYIQSLIEN